MEHAAEHHAAPVGKTYVLARFETGEALVEACYKVREKGFVYADIGRGISDPVSSHAIDAA